MWLKQCCHMPMFSEEGKKCAMVILFLFLMTEMLKSIMYVFVNVFGRACEPHKYTSIISLCYIAFNASFYSKNIKLDFIRKHKYKINMRIHLLTIP